MTADRDRLAALVAQIDRDVAMAAELVEHPATDPLAWLASARVTLKELERLLTAEAAPVRFRDREEPPNQ
jgi:hypothetical protein